MLRCPRCDFVLDNVGSQSNFFQSLPAEERGKRRYKRYDPVTKAFSVACMGCVAPIESERKSATPEQKEAFEVIAVKPNVPPMKREELDKYVAEFYARTRQKEEV